MPDQHQATPDQWAVTEERGRGDYATSSCIVELLHRIEALEATQHAHIEAKASEAGARCAVEQMRSRPGSWQLIKTETTYGSDASIPALSEHYAPVEPERQDKLDRLIEQDRSNAQQLTLVERVARHLARFASEGLPGDDATPIASAVLCDVAEWLRAGAVSNWGLAAADLLHNEASR